MRLQVSSFGSRFPGPCPVRARPVLGRLGTGFNYGSVLMPHVTYVEGFCLGLTLDFIEFCKD